MPSIFGNPDDSGASESPDSSPNPAKRRKRSESPAVMKKFVLPAGQLAQPTSDNKYVFTTCGLSPRQQSKLAQTQIKNQKEDSAITKTNGKGLESSCASTPTTPEKVAIQQGNIDADVPVQSIETNEQLIFATTMSNDFQIFQQHVEHVSAAPRTPEQEPMLSDYIQSSRIQNTPRPGPRVLPMPVPVPVPTPSHLRTPTRAARANGDTWSTTNRRHNPTIVTWQPSAQSPVRLALGGTISQSGLPTHDRQPLSTVEAKACKAQQQGPTYAQKVLLQSSPQQERLRETQQSTNASMTAAESQVIENKKKSFRASNEQRKQTLSLSNDQQRALELQGVQQTFIELHAEASTGLLARQAATEAQRQTAQETNKANERRLFLKLAQTVKAMPGRLERAKISITQKNPRWSQEKVNEQALISEVQHEYSKMQQTADRKEQVKILLTIRPEHVERLHPNAPDKVKKEWMKRLVDAQRQLQSEDHTTTKWKHSYQILLEVGKKLQKARQRDGRGSLQIAASMNSPSSAREEGVGASLPQGQHPLNDLPWLSTPGCWRHDPYTNSYLEYNSFISNEEKANMFQNSAQTELTPLSDPRMQSQTYFLDLYNNANHHHKYYPPASQHTDGHGNICIGNTPFRSYGPNETRGDAGVNANEEAEKEDDWLANGASGYAGMSFFEGK